MKGGQVAYKVRRNEWGVREKVPVYSVREAGVFLGVNGLTGDARNGK
jgi:hypothetical protein